MRTQPPEEFSTYLLLSRLAEVLLAIQKLDQEQKEHRELLGVYIRLQQQEQGEEENHGRE